MQPTNFFNRFLLWFEHQLDQFIAWYGKTLNWVLNHKLIFTGFVLLLFVGTVVMMKQGIIGKELISTGDQGKFRFALEFDKSTSIQQNNLISEKIEKYILQQPEVATVFSNVGGPSTGIGSLGVGMANKTEFTVQLKTKSEQLKVKSEQLKTKNEKFVDVSTEAFMRKLRTDLQKEYSGINFSMMALGLIPRSARLKLH